MVLALATAAIAIFAIASVVSSVFGDKGGACASGATDLAILATSGPVNVGDKFNNPRGGVTTISQEMMGNAQIIVRAGLDYKPNPMSTNGMVIAIGDKRFSIVPVYEEWGDHTPEPKFKAAGSKLVVTMREVK